MLKSERKLGNTQFFALLIFILVLCFCGRCCCECIDESNGNTYTPRWKLVQEKGLKFVARDAHAAAVFKNKIWVMGGHSARFYSRRLIESNSRSDIWNSEDGKNWNLVVLEAPWKQRFGHTLTTFTKLIPFNNGTMIVNRPEEMLVLIGGFTPEPSNDVWLSKDGVKWEETTRHAPFDNRAWHCTVVFNKKLWVMGGSPLKNDVWWTLTAKGNDWVQQKHVPWKPRMAHGCASNSFVTNATIGGASRRNFLYLIGGWDGTAFKDVWRMDRNEKWSLVTPAAPWGARGWHSVISFDSSTKYDNTLGSRIWVIAGGNIGNGILRMHAYNDVWFSRNGADWIRSSSDASGISTGDWCNIFVKNKFQCFGKWGQAVVAFRRPVAKAYFCSPNCTSKDGLYNLEGQLVPMCDPVNKKPDIPYRGNIMVGTKINTVTLYPDGCFICPGTRYVEGTSLPTLMFIAGDSAGSYKSKDIFQSDDALLCESDGKICSNQGKCAVGGVCICNSGLAGEFCEKKSYTIEIPLSKSCFPEDSIVQVSNFSTKMIKDIKIGDFVLSLGQNGIVEFSKVYYLPHRAMAMSKSQYVKVYHEYLNISNGSLEITPHHLIYIRKNRVVDAKSAKRVELNLAEQIPASDLKVGMFIAVISKSNLRWSKITAITSFIKASSYNMYTVNGNYFVNGILCSNFGDFYPHIDGKTKDYLPYMYFSTHRLLYTIFRSPKISVFLAFLDDYLLLPFINSVFNNCFTYQ